MKKSKKRVIPGFGLTMGVTITMLSIIVQLLRKFYHSIWCITGQRCDGTDSCLGAGAL